MTDDVARRFEPYRGRLTALAYRMLGARGDAEDVVQNAFLRFARTLARERIADDAAFLRTVVTRLALDELRSARMRRETYTGTWLPEPLVDETLSPQSGTELADDVSVALLLALERLSPLERAAFLLHDVFDVPFREIASTLERDEAAVRQLAARARTHVREARPRKPPDRAEAERLRAAFARAVGEGDLAGLFSVLARGVVLRSDGGGRIAAAVNPVAGVERVARFFLGLAQKRAGDGFSTRFAEINGMPGILVRAPGGAVDTTIAFRIDDGLIVAIDLVRNPDKLAHLRAT